MLTIITTHGALYSAKLDINIMYRLLSWIIRHIGIGTVGIVLVRKVLLELNLYSPSCVCVCVQTMLVTGC